MKENYMKLDEMGTRIKSVRQEAGMTQEELAEQIDVSPHYIYEIERGSKAMSLQTLEKLSLALHQSIDFLFWGDSIPYAQNDMQHEDRLSTLIKEIPQESRDVLAEAFAAIIPYLKAIEK